MDVYLVISASDVPSKRTALILKVLLVPMFPMSSKTRVNALPKDVTVMVCSFETVAHGTPFESVPPLLSSCSDGNGTWTNYICQTANRNHTGVRTT